MLGVRLYLAQRLTALIMAPLVLAHLITMIVAVRGGLTAGEILGRTQGSFGWAFFYGLFVVAVAIHGAIGLRVVLHESCKVSGKLLNLLTGLIGTALFLLGARAVYAVIFGTPPG